MRTFFLLICCSLGACGAELELSTADHPLHSVSGEITWTWHFAAPVYPDGEPTTDEDSDEDDDAP